MRYIVEKKDREEIVSMYKAGMAMSKIARLTGYTDNTVRAIIKKDTGCYTEYKNGNCCAKIFVDEKKVVRRSPEDLKNQVLTLYGKYHLTIDQIIYQLKDLSRTEIEDILLEAKIITKAPETGRKMVDTQDLVQLIRDCHVGDRYRLGHIQNFITVTIQQKYKRYVVTDKGTFLYTDLLLGKKIIEEE